MTHWAGGRTFERLDAELVGRCAASRKLGNNTYAERRSDGGIAVKLHATDVVTHYPDGRAVYATGGWRTVTTKERMNSFGLPGVQVWSDRGAWFIGETGYPKDDKAFVPFADGVTVRVGEDGRVTFEGGGTPRDLAQERKARRLIQEYAQRCVEAVPLEMPGNGDCFLCMAASAGAPGVDHYYSHFEQGYVVPRLVWDALTYAGYASDQQIMHGLFFGKGEDWDRARELHGRYLAEDGKRAIVKFLKHKFGLA